MEWQTLEPLYVTPKTHADAPGPQETERSDEPRHFIPGIVLDKGENRFTVSGEAYLGGDTVAFFEPILDWLKRYRQDPNPETVLEFRLDYFNTSFSKMAFNMMAMLEGLPDAKIVWHYDRDDPDLLESGEEFMEDLGDKVAFELRPYERKSLDRPLL